jgi:Ca-activated chloride channel family protein
VAGASSADFGIVVRNLYDSLTVSLDGYETQTLSVKTDQWQNIVLKISTDIANKNKPRLVSVTKDFNKANKQQGFARDETYFELVENEWVLPTNFPNTGFSLNVNKASYSNVRRFLNMGSSVPPDAVRTEELVNYFNLFYQTPAPHEVFDVRSTLTNCPWSPENKLLFVNVSAKKIDLDKVPPGNFVFLIDVSGSMDMPNRLPLLKAAFQLFVKNLRDIDTVSIVTYGGGVRVWLSPTAGAQKDSILQSIESLEAQGDTPGESGIKLAYQLARRTFNPAGNNRVILATDGDFNVGETSEKALDELISKQRQSGIYLTCLGVGMGNFKDSKLQTLAKKGNGNYAYLDNINEAERVLVKELTQTLYAVANGVYMNVQFNTSAVEQYRLIGFDNRKDALLGKENELEGGEIGSGSCINAIFEYKPKVNDANLATLPSVLADLELKYQLPNDTVVHKMNRPVYNKPVLLDSIRQDYSLAAAITLFALKLKGSAVASSIGWDEIIAIAKKGVQSNDYLQQEFLTLLSKSKKIYGSGKKKR